MNEQYTIAGIDFMQHNRKPYKVLYNTVHCGKDMSWNLRTTQIKNYGEADL